MSISLLAEAISVSAKDPMQIDTCSQQERTSGSLKKWALVTFLIITSSAEVKASVTWENEHYNLCPDVTIKTSVPVIIQLWEFEYTLTYQ